MATIQSQATIQFATPSQLALLRAALLDCPDAAKAAIGWLAIHRRRSGPGFLWLESGSRRLLPLIYRNVKITIPIELRSDLKQIHDEYCAENQKRLLRLEELLAWFDANGIPTLILKGMALSILHYRDMALRPTSDIDILVPEEEAAIVVSRLQREGWTVDYFLPRAPRYRYFYRHCHAVPLLHPHYGAVDLHWHVLTEATFKRADRAFWKASVTVSVNAIQTRALNPTDQLLHACVHGFAFNVVAAIRWIADAVTVLRTSQIDWPRLVNLAQELHVTLPVSAALSFLRTTFCASIPEEVIRELNAVRVDGKEQLYFERLRLYPLDLRGILANNLERHRRANRDRHPILSIASLPRQFQLHYNLPRLADLGTFAFSLLRKRISKRLGYL